MFLTALKKRLQSDYILTTLSQRFMLFHAISNRFYMLEKQIFQNAKIPETLDFTGFPVFFCQAGKGT